MQKGTLTTIEKLTAGDLFMKKDGGYVYRIEEVKKTVRHKKVFSGTCRRIDQARLMNYRANTQVIFLGKHKTETA